MTYSNNTIGWLEIDEAYQLIGIRAERAGLEEKSNSPGTVAFTQVTNLKVTTNSHLACCDQLKQELREEFLKFQTA